MYKFKEIFMELELELVFPIEEYNGYWIRMIRHPLNPNPRNNSSNIGTIVTWSDKLRGRVGYKDDVLFNHHSHYRRKYVLNLKALYGRVDDHQSYEKWQEKAMIYIPLYVVISGDKMVNCSGWPGLSTPIGGWLYVLKVKFWGTKKHIYSKFKNKIIMQLKRELQDFSFYLLGEVWTYKIIGGSIDKIGPAYYGEGKEIYATVIQAAMLEIDRISSEFFNKQLKLFKQV